MKFADAWEAFKQLPSLRSVNPHALSIGYLHGNTVCRCSQCEEQRMRRDNAAQAQQARKEMRCVD